MRQNLKFFLLALAWFWLEAGFRKAFPGSHAVPQFLLVFAVIMALRRDLKESLVASLLAGFLGEFFSGLYFGSVMFVLLASTVLVIFLPRSFKRFSMIVATLAAPLWVFVYNLVGASLRLAASPDLLSLYSWSLFLQIFANLVAFFVIDYTIKRIFRE